MSRSSVVQKEGVPIRCWRCRLGGTGKLQKDASVPYGDFSINTITPHPGTVCTPRRPGRPRAVTTRSPQKDTLPAGSPPTWDRARLTEDEPHHGAEVAGAAAQVQEGKARLQVQGLHHLRVDARSGEVDVAVLPRQVLVRVLLKLLEVIVGAVNSSEGPLHQLGADVLRRLQMVYQLVVVFTSTHRTSHLRDRAYGKLPLYDF